MNLNDNFECINNNQFGGAGCDGCIWAIKDAQANPSCYFYEVRDMIYQVRERAKNLKEEDDEACLNEVLDKLLGIKRE